MDKMRQKYSLGIRNKLYLTLFTISSLTLILGVIAWNAFNTTDKALQKMTLEAIPIENIVSQITNLSAHSSTIVSRLAFVKDNDELNHLHNNLVKVMQEEKTLLKRLNHLFVNSSDDVERIISLNKEEEEKLLSLKDRISAVLQVANVQNWYFEQLKESRNDFTLAIAPISDDTIFEIVIGLEGVGEEDLNHKILKLQAETLYAALEVKADGMILAGLLETALHSEDVESIGTLKERFESTITRLKRNFSQLTLSGNEDYLGIFSPIEKMEELGKGHDNIFEIRRFSLAQLQELKNNIKQIDLLNKKIGGAMDNLSLLVKNDVQAAKLIADDQILSGKVVIFVVSFVSLMLSLFIGLFYIRKKIIYRLEELKRIMIEISNNNFSSDINDDQSDEITEMARALKVFKEKMIENVQLLKYTEESAEKANKARVEAEHANSVKTEFLANMSHELRTPMHAIKGFADIGIKRADKWDADKHITNLSKISYNGERLLSLISNLLDAAKLDAGAVFYDMKQINLEDIINDSVYFLQSLLSQKGVSINIFPVEVPPIITGDSEKITQVIVNLLSNAIKFTAEHSDISISINIDDLVEKNDAFRIAIYDQGVGVPDQDKEVIFDKFVQSSKTKTGAGGTGLGLAITKQIVEDHKGKIWVEDNSAGKGACFVVVLPINNSKDGEE